MSAARFERVIDQLQSKEIPPEQVCHVHYRDLVRDPMGTIAHIYDHFGIPLTDRGRAGMETFLRENPRDNRPPHRYPIPEGAELARARDAYRRYQDYIRRAE